jgi:hypothetical protein
MNFLSNLFHKNGNQNQIASGTRFNHIMKTAEKLEELNPKALVELTRIVLRPLQSELLLSAVENEMHGAREAVRLDHFFMKSHMHSLYNLESYENKKELNPEDFLIHLNRDPILPCPWHQDRYVDALHYIGEGKKINPYTQTTTKWKEDPTNHYAKILQPWGIVFVGGGNHSIAAGIIAGEGILRPKEVIDMSSVFDQVKCDGKHYIDRKTGEIMEAVTDENIAALFEIGRLIGKHKIQPMLK